MILRRILTASCLIGLAACSNALLLPDSKQRPWFKADATLYIGEYDSDTNTDSFLGVPFAQAPINSLRWMPPRPVKPDQKTVEANRYADACEQGPHLYNWYQNVIASFGGNGSDFTQAEFNEDCLYLNIWRPHKQSTNNKELMPIFVFIHGGSNKGGWSYEPNYIGKHLAAKNAVVITIAYRLGVFGFFSHPDLEHANFGLLDQIAALRWIKQHAVKLGGDPNNITIAGESSGASNIAYLLTSPLAGGLFKRAIHQSAGWAMRDNNAKIDSDRLGTLLSTHSFPDRTDTSIDGLRALSSETIFASADVIYSGHFFDPVIDGLSVTAPLAETIKTSRLNAEDLMIGSNANEALMYVDQAQTPLEWLSENAPNADPSRIAEVFGNKLSNLQKLDQLATAYGYACPSLQLASLFAKRDDKQAWVYLFGKVREGQLAAQMGAYHGAELPYIFNTHDKWLPTNSEDITLGESMMDYWIQFALNGNPNPPRQQTWQPYTAQSKAALILNTDTVSIKHPSFAICHLLLEQIN